MHRAVRPRSTPGPNQPVAVVPYAGHRRRRPLVRGHRLDVTALGILANDRSYNGAPDTGQVTLQSTSLLMADDPMIGIVILHPATAADAAKLGRLGGSTV